MRVNLRANFTGKNVYAQVAVSRIKQRLNLYIYKNHYAKK